MKQNSILTKTPQAIAYALILVLVGLLSIYGLKGTYSRYAQDDYCYGYRVRSLGFLEMQVHSYFQVNEYNSDRYSLTIAHSLVELSGGPKIVPFLTSFEFLAWLAALVYVFIQLQKLVNSKANYLPAIFTALTIVFFSAYLAPNQYQVLFWLSAMQTYLTPIIWTTFIIGRLIAMASSAKFNLLQGLELSLLALFAGGFSETTALWQFAIWGMILAWSVLFRKKQAAAGNLVRPTAVVTVFTAVSLVIMAICPINFNTGVVFYHPKISNLILQSLSYGAGFIWIGIKGAPLPYLAIATLGFFISLVTQPKNSPKAKNLAWEIVLALLALYILSVAVIAPSYYATSHYPGDRALLPAEATLVAFLFFIGWKMAELLSAILPERQTFRLLIVINMFAGLALVLYLVHIAPRVYDKISAYQGRAEAWDLRQQLILEEKAAGIENVTAPAFDSVYGITELHYEPTNWVNICAARYYGVQSISTVDNYAGISTHPIGK
ncbi:MAG TPA: DUF6056 family protein [Anaerolineales bacterium]|nr:DUF6056 family protein [Anaerolineales bacterium]